MYAVKIHPLDLDLLDNWNERVSNKENIQITPKKMKRRKPNVRNEDDSVFSVRNKFRNYYHISEKKMFMQMIEMFRSEKKKREKMCQSTRRAKTRPNVCYVKNIWEWYQCSYYLRTARSVQILIQKR